MAPKQKITQQLVLDGAIALVEANGMESLSSKSLAQQLNCSTQPIFWYYNSINDIKQAVEQYAEQLFAQYLRQYLPDISPYKTIGINYIRFAKEHKQLFKLLLMSNKMAQDILHNNANLPFIKQTLQAEHHLTDQVTNDIVEQMWIFAHGIATMIATNTADISNEEVSKMISNVFHGLLKVYSC